MPAAIPLISTGISAIGGAISSRNRAKQQKQQQAQFTPLIQGQTALAGQAAQQGRQLFGFGGQQLGAAAGYYNTLLNGNRAAMTQAVQPEIAGITDVYRGAERSLERSGVQGAARDVAQGDLARDRAGRIAGLVGGVRPMAAGALGQMGQFGIQAGQQGTQQAGNMLANLMSGITGAQQQGLEAQKYGDEQNRSMWGNIGKLIVDSYGAYRNRGASA